MVLGIFSGSRVCFEKGKVSTNVSIKDLEIYQPHTYEVPLTLKPLLWLADKYTFGFPEICTWSFRWRESHRAEAVSAIKGTDVNVLNPSIAAKDFCSIVFDYRHHLGTMNSYLS